MDKNIETTIINRLSDLAGNDCEALFEMGDGQFELRLFTGEEAVTGTCA